MSVSPFSGPSTPVLSSGTSTPVNVAKIEALREKLVRHSSANLQGKDRPETGGRGSRHVSPADRSHPTHSASASPADRPASRGHHDSTPQVTIAGILTVRVIGGRNLKAMENGGWFGVKTSSHSNPFCVITLGSQVARSSVVMNDLNPRWSREQFFFDIPLPPLEATGPETTISPLLGKHGALNRRPNFLFDPHNPILSVKMYHKSTKAEGGRQDDTDCKKEQGDLIGEGSFNPIELLMGKVTTCDLWISLGDGAGEVRISADYDSKGLSPRVGDLARPVGFGSSVTDLVFPLNVVLTVQAVNGDHVLVSFLTDDEGWESTLELHRNAIFVLERSTVVTQAYSLVVRQANWVQHSTLGGLVVSAYKRLPRRYQRWGKLAMAMTKQGAYYTFEVLKQGLEELHQDGVSAGWESLKHGARLTFDLIKQDYEVTKVGIQTQPSSSHKHEEPSKGASAKDGDTETDTSDDEDCPSQLLCPITGAPMRDPVVAADGHTYDRPAIEKWFATHDTSPMTGVKLPTLSLFPNYSFRAMAQERRASRIELKRKKAADDLIATAAPGEDDSYPRVLSGVSEGADSTLESLAVDQEEEKAAEGSGLARMVLSRSSTVAFDGLEDEQQADSPDLATEQLATFDTQDLPSPPPYDYGVEEQPPVQEEQQADDSPLPRLRAQSTYAFDGEDDAVEDEKKSS